LQRAFTADRGDAGLRIDLVLRRHLTGVDAATRTRVQTWIEEGRVAINGAVVRRVSARTLAGDAVTIVLPELEIKSPPTAQELPLDILYEDDHLVAVNKPPGLVVHPTYKHTDATLLNALLWRARDWAKTSRPSVVGRLDKLTSGLVLVAKSPAVHAALQRTLAAPGSRKEYLALVWGRTSGGGTIDLRLRRDPGDRRRVIASMADGAPSRTEYVRLSQAAVVPESLTLLQCRLVTGRTHQIRVHLAASGWPIVGDPKYGEPRWQQIADDAARTMLSQFSRQALHAWRLSFTHPATGQAIAIEAPPARDFAMLLRTVMRLDPFAIPRPDSPPLR
jgi:23S rRNA pseudouridine1911/1915/1917 synthase